MNLVGSVVRGEVLARIDESLNREDLDESITRLKSNRLFEVADERQGLRSDEERRHAKEDAFNIDAADENASATGWWPEGQQVEETGREREEIIRAAYLRALEVKRERKAAGQDKPIHTLWIRGSDRVEAYVVETGLEILVQWLTPDPPEYEKSSGRTTPPPADKVSPITDEGIWAVGTPARIDGYIARFDAVGGYAPERRSVGEGRTVEYEGIAGAKAFHLISY